MPRLLPGGPSLPAPSWSARSAASAGCGLRTTPGEEAGVGEGNRRQFRDDRDYAVDVHALPRTEDELQAGPGRKRDADHHVAKVEEDEEHVDDDHRSIGGPGGSDYHQGGEQQL